MEYLCILCPAFISLYFYVKDNKNLSVWNIVCYYFIHVNIINLTILLICSYFFKTYLFQFNVIFSIKYLFLGNFFAIIYPKIESIIKSYYLNHKNNIKKKFLNFKENLFKKNIVIKLRKLNHKNITKSMLFIFLNVFMFWIIDFFLRYLDYNIVEFYSLGGTYPNLFTVIMGLLVSVIILCLPRLFSKIFLIITTLFNILLFLIHYMLLQIKSQAFSVYDLSNVDEGLRYISFIFKEINIVLILFLILLIIITIINFKLLNKIVKPRIKIRIILLIISILCFVLIRYIGIHLLKDYNTGEWGQINSPGYYYDNFVNYNKSLLVLGLYEYTYRDIYLYIESRYETFGSVEEIEEIIANSELEYAENEYTSIFEGKNLIMIQMESIDNLVINENVMPALTYMRKNGWNFTGRYTSNVGTFSAEFAILTGLYYVGSQYNIENNIYNNSLPNIFDSVGYSTQSVHENYGRYYNRSKVHQNFGFENSYFLYDIFGDEALYAYDPQIVENPDIYDNIVSESLEPFFSYIITISAHGAYDNNGYCIGGLGDDYVDEYSCLTYLSGLTDKMLEELLNNLEDDGLLEDTVIVLFSDHYPYAYDFSEEELAEIERIDEAYNVRNIPFIIYAEGFESQEIDTLFNDVDVLPTILNLFGIEYDPRIYVGVDIFSEDHQDLIFLADYTWYDGNIYSGNYLGDATDEYIANNEYMMDKLNFNRMIISNNYYSNSDLNLVE